MTAKTVTIYHPHAEVIAAYYSGKTVQIRGTDRCEWKDRSLKDDRNDAPLFLAAFQWRIKPEPLVKWIEVDGDGYFSGKMWSHKPPYESALSGQRIVRMVEQPE